MVTEPTARTATKRNTFYSICVYDFGQQQEKIIYKNYFFT